MSMAESGWRCKMRPGGVILPRAEDSEVLGERMCV